MKLVPELNVIIMKWVPASIWSIPVIIIKLVSEVHLSLYAIIILDSYI